MPQANKDFILGELRSLKKKGGKDIDTSAIAPNDTVRLDRGGRVNLRYIVVVARVEAHHP